MGTGTSPTQDQTILNSSIDEKEERSLAPTFQQISFWK